jgi:hypothetical protein
MNPLNYVIGDLVSIPRSFFRGGGDGYVVGTIECIVDTLFWCYIPEYGLLPFLWDDLSPLIIIP